MRPVALVSYFDHRMFLHDITSFDRALSFLKRNPRVCRKITELSLKGRLHKTSQYEFTVGTPLDDAMVSDILQLLPNVEYLYVRHFVYVPSPHKTLHSAAPDRLPHRGLKRCQIEFANCQAEVRDSSVSGLFRILALFPSIEQLRIYNGACKFGTSPPFDLPALCGPSIRIRSIEVREHRARDVELLGGTLKLVQALRATTAPGVLESLEVWCSSREEVAAVGELIAHARGALTNLNIGTQDIRNTPGRKGWQDPLDNHWPMLNLTSCAKLDALEVNIRFREDWGSADKDVLRPRPEACRLYEDKPKGSRDVTVSDAEDTVMSLPGNKDVLRPSRAALGMLSQVSGTVRDVTIRIHDLPRKPRDTIEVLKQGRLLGLQAFDEAITETTFPCINKVHLRTHFRWNLGNITHRHWKETHNLVWSKTLRNLDKAGLLDFGFKVREDRGLYRGFMSC